MKKIYSELSRIQQELKAPKNLYNSFGKYRYRNAEGILEAVKPLLKDSALIINDEPVVLGDRYYIKATVTLTDGEESVSAVAYAREDAEKRGMDGCQLTGACSSYARKYALNALLMIDDAKDSDDDSLSPKNPANAEERTINPPAKPATIEKSNRLPAEETPNPTANFIRNEIADIQERLKLDSYMAARTQVMAWVDELVRSGAINPVNWQIISLSEAKKVFEAVRKTYRPGEAA